VLVVVGVLGVVEVEGAGRRWRGRSAVEVEGAGRRCWWSRWWRSTVAVEVVASGGG
jgi:hypothetical protein